MFWLLCWVLLNKKIRSPALREQAFRVCHVLFQPLGNEVFIHHWKCMARVIIPYVIKKVASRSHASFSESLASPALTYSELTFILAHVAHDQRRELGSLDSVQSLAFSKPQLIVESLSVLDDGGALHQRLCQAVRVKEEYWRTAGLAVLINTSHLCLRQLPGALRGSLWRHRSLS